MTTRLQIEPPQRVGRYWVVVLSECRSFTAAGWAWCDKAPSAVVLVGRGGVSCLDMDGRAIELESLCARVPALDRELRELGVP